MKVLWVTFFMLPDIAIQNGMQQSNKEGWISGLAERVAGSDIDLRICFALPLNRTPIQGSVTIQGKEIPYRSFSEDMVNLHQYNRQLEKEAAEVLNWAQPDILHIFGTEYPHSLAFAKAFAKPKQTLVGLQGLMCACTEHYLDGVPETVCRQVTFRDWLKQDSMLQQKEKFAIRAQMERELLEQAGTVTGRTGFDRAIVEDINPTVVYHFMNETLRGTFYEGIWDLTKAEPHSILITQGNYPLKGLHCVLQQLPDLIKKYPDLQLYVAGDCITAYETWKDKIKISGYGKYLRTLIRKENLAEHVHFVGKLNAEEMKDRMLRSQLVLSASSVENSSNSIGEAMLLGVPVAATRVGGIPDLMQDHIEGLFYNWDNFVEVVSRLFDDERLSCSLSENARKRARKTHNQDDNRRRLLEIYDTYRNFFV